MYYTVKLQKGTTVEQYVQWFTRKALAELQAKLAKKAAQEQGLTWTVELFKPKAA